MAPRCFALQNPIFQPSMTLIASITTSNPAVVTTTFSHNYKTGLIVRLDIPEACGMPQANGTDGAIVVTSPTTFNYALDTTTFQPFVIPMSAPPAVDICAQCVPIGEVSERLDSAVQNVLPFGPI